MISIYSVVAGLKLTQVDLEEVPKPFDVIAAWHPRYNEDTLQKWVISKLSSIYA